MISLMLPNKNNAYLVRRSQVELYDGPALATLTLSEEPEQDFRLAVTISGGVCTGTVTITGTLDEEPKSEILTFTGPRTRLTSITMDKITSITTAGLADEAIPPNIRIGCIDPQGAEIREEILTPIKIRVEHKSTYYQQDGGVWVRSDSRGYTLASLEIGDVVRYGSTDYTVQERYILTLMNYSYRKVLF